MSASKNCCEHGGRGKKGNKKPLQNEPDRQAIRQLHAADQSHLRKSQFDTWAFVALSVLAAVAWQGRWWPAVLPLWLTAGYFGLTKSLLFHDAAHGTMHPRCWVNEAMGIMLGTLFFVPLSVYRHAHALHHAGLASRRDPELWPFTLPHVPRALRLLAAFAEIVLAIVYTPALFLRSVLVTPPPRRIRRRIAGEYALAAAVWGALLTVVAWNELWGPFLLAYLIPAAIAAAFQTLNKYVEHLGLTGDSILACTRTVADTRTVGQWLSYSMQHVDYHGTHHRYAKIPFYHLPAATPLVYHGQEETLPLFSSYWGATLDMLRTLGDPKAGPQWRTNDRSPEISQRRPSVLRIDEIEKPLLVDRAHRCRKIKTAGSLPPLQ